MSLFLLAGERLGRRLNRNSALSDVPTIAALVNRAGPDCGAKFYDLRHSPITCPKCGMIFEAAKVSSRFRAEARVPGREVEPVVAETQEVQLVSLEDADAEAQGKKKPGEAHEAEDEVELDDESLDDVAFIQENEEEETDVTEIIGGDIEIEKGT